MLGDGNKNDRSCGVFVFNGNTTRKIIGIHSKIFYFVFEREYI